MTDFNNTPSPNEALAAIHQTQSAVADNYSRHSWRYDLSYSALLGLMVAAVGLPMPYAMAGYVVPLAGLILLARNWKRQKGVWISGTTPPKARWIAILLGLAILPVMLANLILSHVGDPRLIAMRPWFPVIAGLIAAALALRGSRLWRRVYRGENGLQP